MNKQEFLYRLESLLMDLPKSERDDALDYYEQYFEAAGPEREAEVIRELGSPEKVSEMIHSDGAQERSGWTQENRTAGQWMYTRPERPKKSRLPLWIALGACVIFVGLGLLFLMLGAVSFDTVKKVTVSQTDAAGTENTEGWIENFVQDIVVGVTEQALDSITDLEESGALDQIGAEIEESFRQENQEFEQMRDDYRDNPDQIQEQGKAMLRRDGTLAWKEVKEIRLQVPDTAVLICRVSGDTVQAEASREQMAEAQYSNGRLVIECVQGGKKDARIILFLPEDLKLETLEIEAEDGYIETEDLETGSFQAQIQDGMLKNTGTVRTGTFFAEIGDGCMEGGIITASDSMEISVEDGVFYGSRLESPGIELTCGDGVLKAGLAGQESEYSWEAEAGDGLLKVGKEQIRGSSGKAGGEKSLTVSMGDGIGTVNFGK